MRKLLCQDSRELSLGPARLLLDGHELTLLALHGVGRGVEVYLTKLNGKDTVRACLDQIGLTLCSMQ